MTDNIDPPQRGSASTLPLVVEVGFAGSRRLFDAGVDPKVDPDALDQQVTGHLVDVLRRMPAVLGLDRRHFLCGISQIAIGADTAFTRACARLDIPQQILLPQSPEEYLRASGSDGEADFPGSSLQIARDLLDAPHIVHARVVSDALDRTARFEDVNLEIVRTSAVIVCLLREGADARPGGTVALLNHARLRGRAVLEIRVGESEGKASFSERWHGLEGFSPPVLPREIECAGPPPDGQPDHPVGIVEFTSALKAIASTQARWQRRLFQWIAFVIIGTHVVATVCALGALKMYGTAAIPWLLGAELALLATGFGVHRYLHGSRACQEWAMSRLVAEIARSSDAVGTLPVHLGYLFVLPFPEDVRGMLKTINVLHLRRARSAAAAPWEPTRDGYVESRLGLQSQYHRSTQDRAGRWLRTAHWAFIGFSTAAFVATLAKLLVHLAGIPVPDEHTPLVESALGFAAILFPVLAVSALSLAAAFDVEASFHVSSDMTAFVTAQAQRLRDAASPREFATLLLETERHLVGETAIWYSRRAFTGVA